MEKKKSLRYRPGTQAKYHVDQPYVYPSSPTSSVPHPYPRNVEENEKMKDFEIGGSLEERDLMNDEYADEIYLNDAPRSGGVGIKTQLGKKKEESPEGKFEGQPGG